MSEQNNQESKTGWVQTITVNGVCMVIALIGLALISSHLLDKANAANERGLSVDERIQKALPNDESYAQQYGGLTRIGWFGVDYDCNNNAVVEEIKEYIACKFLMVCSGAGFTGFKQIAKLDSAGVSRWFEAYQRREIANGTAKTINPTEAELRWGRNTIAKIADDQRRIYNTFSRLFDKAKVMTDDVNPATKKYVCRMTFNYDSSMVLPWYDYVTRTNLLRNKGFMAGVNASLQKNPNLDMVDTTTQVWLRTNNIEQKAASNPPATATYTVQPSSDGRFSVDISHVTLPGGD